MGATDACAGITSVIVAAQRVGGETHTQIVNRMHSVAHRHHLTHERGKRFNEKNTGWQKDKRLSKMEQFQLELEMENRSLPGETNRAGREGR